MKYFNWEDITIQQFNEISSITEIKIDELDKCVHYLSVITGRDVEHYMGRELHKLEQELRMLSGITSKKPEPRFDGSGAYIVNEKKYKLTLSATHMTAGQYIDYTNTIDKHPVDVAMLCAIVLIPEGVKYGEGYDVFELRDELNTNFKIVDAMGISFFFQESFEALYAASLRSLIRILKKEKKKNKNPYQIKTIEGSIRQISQITSGKKLISK